jgi:DNA-binding beta-propeller fold protein YncE
MDEIRTVSGSRTCEDRRFRDDLALVALTRLIRVALSLALVLAGCGQSSMPSTSGDGGSGGEAAAGSGGGGDRPGGGGAGGSGGGGVGTGGVGGPPIADAASGGTPGSDAGEPVDVGPSAKADRAPIPTGPGKIVLIAGGGNGGDGTPAAMASTNKPFGAVVDPLNGDVYIAEFGGHRVRRIDDKGIISTVMGAGATGPGGKMTLGQPHNLLFQPNTHNLFVADTFAGRVIKMDATTGESAVFVGGLGTAYCLAFDPTGEHLYVTSGGVTIIDLKTMATTKVNTPSPRVIAVDSKKNLYLGGGGSLRVADAMGKITDVMGSGGLAAPKHLSIDLDDNVIISDTESNTIRKYVVATKTVVKIAGGGGGALGGSPDMAQLKRPHGAFVDGQGRIFIADSFNDRVLRIDY